MTRGRPSLEADVVRPYVEVRCHWSGIGAGTVIDWKGERLILTAGHVVAGYEVEKPERSRVPLAIKVRGGGSQIWETKVVAYSTKEENGGSDLALLKPEDSSELSSAILFDSALGQTEVGEDVWYIGTPNGTHARLEKSILSIMDARYLYHGWWVVNGCGYHGNSGGGLYLLRGDKYRLAGVVTRGNNAPKGEVYVKPWAEVKKFLDSYRSNTK